MQQQPNTSHLHIEMNIIVIIILMTPFIYPTVLWVPVKTNLVVAKLRASFFISHILSTKQQQLFIMEAYFNYNSVDWERLYS
jgi:hypothetical protein